MAQLNPYAQYNNVTFETASPVGLVVTSYEAAVRGLKEAQRAIRDKDYASRTRNIDLAFGLISELRKSLNPEKGGEVADKLNALYEFFQREIVTANATNDADRLNPIVDMMSDLHQAWDEASRKLRQENAAASFSA